MNPSAAERLDRDLHDATREFAHDSVVRSWVHLLSTITILTAALAAAAFLPWWPARLAGSVIGALVLVRTFILYHDFMHGAILPKSSMARFIFSVYGCLNLTPPRSWRASHNFHHANVGRIDASDVGSFTLMTSKMWREATPRQRLAYRIIRSPITILFAYVTVFLVNVSTMPLIRRPGKHWDSAVALLLHGGLAFSLWWFLGFDAAFFALFLPMTIAGALGGYLFYAQHSFPGMRILPEGEWNHYRASLASSSYLRTGPVMRWFTGNIGFHHIHHLNPLIPFYRLPDAMDGIPELQHPVVTTLRPADIVACFRSNLWDEDAGRMVDYSDVRAGA
jgi:omega-6 fatty acid desaturase (delta-12 desaturase)